jgi:hypothetical protein
MPLLGHVSMNDEPPIVATDVAKKFDWDLCACAGILICRRKISTVTHACNLHYDYNVSWFNAFYTH